MLKPEEIKIGQIVYAYFGSFYTVQSNPLEDGTIAATCHYSKKIKKLSIKDLYLYDKEKVDALGKATQEKIDDVSNKLEEAFKYLKELKHLQVDGIYISDMRAENIVSFSNIEHIMDSAGWSSSSLWC